MFTSLYRIRIRMHSIFSLNKLYLPSIRFKEPVSLIIPYVILGSGSVFLGKILHTKMESLLYFRNSANEETIVLISLFILGIIYFFPLAKERVVSKKAVQFLSQLWFVESLSSQPISFFMLKSGSYIILSLEKGWLEYFGPQGVFIAFSSVAQSNEKLQYKYFMSCILTMLLTCMVGALTFLVFYKQYFN